MKFKLSLLVLFTAVVSFACTGTTQMARQEPPIKTREASGSYKPITTHRTDLILGGLCVAKLTFDPKTGDLINVATDPPCRVTDEDLLVNGKKILDISGLLTFGGSHLGCYYVTGRAKCIGH